MSISLEDIYTAMGYTVLKTKDGAYALGTMESGGGNPCRYGGYLYDMENNGAVAKRFLKS